MKPALSSSTASSLLKKEEEDLARAIQLSIKESTAQASKQSSNSSNLKSSNKSFQEADNQKVKALYDFEAVEENEITFKAGDILFVTDNSDQNWWKGYDKNGKEGLFPSNFVTSDLAYEIETFETKSLGSDKKVSFNSTVNVKELTNEVEDLPRYDQIVINEKKIDECIDLLQNADPTGEIQPDSQEMLNLEDECYMMGPLIDQQLQKIDYKHATLEDLNLKILEAFQMYNNLMKDSLSKSNSFIGNPAAMYSAGGMANSGVMANNYINPMNASQTNSIPFVAAPPQSEASPHALASQLNNFASNNFSSMPVTASAVGLPNYIQNYNPYPSYNLPNEHLNVNQTVGNNFVGAPLTNPNSLPVVAANGMNSMQPDGSYQQHSLAMNSSVQYGQPS